MGSKEAQSSAYEIGSNGRMPYHQSVPMAEQQHSQSNYAVSFFIDTQHCFQTDITQQNGPLVLKGYL
jgi:hypothetical protein